MDIFLLIALVLIADDCVGHLRSAVLGKYKTSEIRNRLPRWMRPIWMARFKSDRNYDLYWTFYWALVFSLLLIPGDNKVAAFALFFAVSLMIFHLSAGYLYTRNGCRAGQPNYIHVGLSDDTRALILTTSINGSDIAWISYDAEQLDGLVQAIEKERMKLKMSKKQPTADPVSEDDLIEGQKIAEALAEHFPCEMNSHKGRLFNQLKIMVAALARDLRASNR